MSSDTLRNLWVLARPGMAHYVGALTLVGFGWGHWDRALILQDGIDGFSVFCAWTLLHVGTMWLNASQDQDEGEVLFGRAAPVPPGTATCGYVALLAAVALAAWTHPSAGLCAAACAILSVLYSHPATVWKGHPVGGPLVNLLGYGLLSPMAGWTVLNVAPNLRTFAAWAIGALGIMGCYFAAQVFQQEEDRARGYRTLVATHGPATTLRVARRCLAGGFWFFALLTLAGWFPRVCLLAVPLWLWVDQWMSLWAVQPKGGNAAWATGMTRRLWWSGWIVLLLTFGEYAHQSLSDEPVAGLGTAAGHPPDRPRLPPRKLRRWEARQR